MLTSTKAVATHIPVYLPAIPFAISGLFIGLAQLATRFVGRQLEKDAQQQIDSSDDPPLLLQLLPVELRSGPLRQRFEWSIDLVVATSAVVPPIVGLLAFLPAGLGAAGVPLVGGVSLVALLLIFLLLGVEPTAYGSWSRPRGRPWALSLVTWVGLIVNLAAAVTASLLAAFVT